MMIPWFQDTKWEPVPCCLADHPDFLLYMSLVDNSVTMGPWFKLSVFGELGLNNWGRLKSRENPKVWFCKLANQLPRQAFWLNILMQAEAEAAQAEHQAHWRAVKIYRKNKLGPRMTCQLHILLWISRLSFRLLVSHSSPGCLWARALRQAPSRRKILGKVDWSQNVQWSVLIPPCKLRNLVAERWQMTNFEVQINPTCTNIGFSICALSRWDRIWRKGTKNFMLSPGCWYLAMQGKQLRREPPVSK